MLLRIPATSVPVGLFFCFRHDDTHYLHFLSLSVEYMIMLTLSSHRNAMKFG